MKPEIGRLLTVLIAQRARSCPPPVNRFGAVSGWQPGNAPAVNRALFGRRRAREHSGNLRKRSRGEQGIASDSPTCFACRDEVTTRACAVGYNGPIRNLIQDLRPPSRPPLAVSGRVAPRELRECELLPVRTCVWSGVRSGLELVGRSLGHRLDRSRPAAEA